MLRGTWSLLAVEMPDGVRTGRRHGAKRRWLTFAALAATLASISTPAQAEPSGGAYEFARESIANPGLVSAESGRALSFWSTGGEAGARVLGRWGPLTARVALGGSPSPGVVAATTGTGRYVRVWVERTADPCFGCYDYSFYSQVLDRNGVATGSPALVMHRGVDGVMRPAALAWNPVTRRFLMVYVVDDEGYTETGAILLTEAGAPIPDSRKLLSDGDLPGMALATRPKDGTYLLTWEESGEIRGQILTSAGSFASSPSFTVTRHSNLVGRIENREPAIAVDPATNESIVAWSDRYEVLARRITAAGSVTGPDLRLSRMGPLSDPDWLTRSPDIAYSPGAQQYLVVWQSGPGTDPYPAGEFVYGQHLNRTGGQIGTNDFKISTLDRAVEPAVTSFPASSDFLVAWSSRRTSPSAWARRVTRTP